MAKLTPEMTARVNMFVDKLQALYDKTFTEKHPLLVPPLISIDASGIKYLRVVTTNRYKDSYGNLSSNGRSVYCFIDAANGDLLKAAGWKTPAKGARGSIFNDNCDVGVRADLYGSGLYASRG